MRSKLKSCGWDACNGKELQHDRPSYPSGAPATRHLPQATGARSDPDAPAGEGYSEETAARQKELTRSAARALADGRSAQGEDAPRGAVVPALTPSVTKLMDNSVDFGTVVYTIEP